MGSIDWNALAEKAAQQTDTEFQSQLANLTSLKVSEIETYIKESNISNENAIKVLKEINDAALSNNQKATAIKNIDNGVGFLISLVTKIV